MSEWTELRLEHEQPGITFQGTNGALGYSRAIEPPPEQQPEIEAFCAAINDAIRKSA